MTHETLPEKIGSRYREGGVVLDVITADAQVEARMPADEVQRAKQSLDRSGVEEKATNYVFYGIRTDTLETITVQTAVYFPPWKGRKPEEVGWLLHLLHVPVRKTTALETAFIAKAMNNMIALLASAGLPYDSCLQFYGRFSKIIGTFFGSGNARS